MDRQGPSREVRWAHIQCVIALAIILVAFWVSDVAPGQPDGAAHETPWTAPLRALDDALAQKSAPAAARAWHEAYLAALASPRWDGMVAVGEASLRLAEVTGQRQAGEAKARTAYLAAFFRARQQNAVDGVLRTAQAFADLGDREVVEQCLRVAQELAARAGDPEAEARVRAMTGRLAAR